ncbi:TPA: antitoxin [Enterococcus faecium]|jgi:hypothetical protein|uniref:antitoxin n=1 Tax=Enterococcus sp. DIV0206e TaxID=2774690 RepID=UPI001A05A346|nr:hypothetical protein [Enterococcus faecalis]EME7220454.1 antitoxin [Enterococcus faecium]HDA6121884.1 antitoxin [Enterococcus faecium]
MNKNYDYNQTFKIEQLNELSKGTTARLIGYLTKQNIDIKNSPNNLYVTLYLQFKEMLNLNLFKLNEKQLEQTEDYWKSMSQYVSSITNTKSVA